MKKWITISLSLVALGALIVALSRWLLPVLGLTGAGNEKLRPLEGFWPWLLWIFLGALVLLAINLRWNRFFRSRNQPLRLVDEAEEWSDDFRIGADLEASGAVDEQAPASALPESRVRLFPEQLEPEPVAARAESVVVDTATQADVNTPSPTRSRVTVAVPADPEAQVVELQANVGETAENEDEITPADIAKAATQAQAEAPPTSRFQLPARPEEFTGRAAELVQLLTASENPEQRVLCIQGPAGIGKTALACVLAQQLAARYPSAQFCLDLKGACLNPLPVAEAQASVLRVLQPEAHPQVAAAELQTAFGAALEGKRVLFLLDNAAEAAQVERLLPPPDCLTIVTTRAPLALPGTFTLTLPVLPENESEELLLRLVPRAAEHASRIAQLCAGWPLALRLAASSLAQRPELSAANYASRLEQIARREVTEQERAPANPIEAALTLSYELLSPGLQKLWRLLAIFPDSFDVTGAAAVWALRPERALKALRRLMDFELVEGRLAAARYRLHDLKRNFAASWLPALERRTAQQSHAEYYQSVLHEADALYEQGGAALKRGLELVEREWQNLETGQTWAATHAEHDRAACELCSSYPDAGRFVLELRQHPRERLVWCEAALAAAHRLERGKAESRHLLALSKANLHLGEFENARVCAEKALAFAQAQADASGEARALNALSTVCYATGQWQTARALAEQALALARAAGEQRSEAQALGCLGLAQCALAEAAARATLEAQLELTRAIGDWQGEGAALGGLARLANMQGELRQALELGEQQLRVTRHLGDRCGEASALNQLGRGYFALAQYEAAHVFHTQALNLARAGGDHNLEMAALAGQGQALFQIALSHAQNGLRQKAIAQAEAALLCLQEAGSDLAEQAHWQLAEWRRA